MKGFTLIEVVSSLLIFAIGGTMALSVFNFNATNRVDIVERTDAFEIANNKLQTLLLRSETDSDWNSTNVLTNGNWNTPTDNAVPIQEWNADGATPTAKGVQKFDGSANSLKGSGDSIYEWRYKLDRFFMKINRSTMNGKDYTNPVGTQLDFSSGQTFMLTVEVSWPNTISNLNERKKVTVQSVITCPA